MKKRRFTGYLIALLLCCGLGWAYYYHHIPQEHSLKESGFNRALTPLIYTRHARCRMSCRHISESEIKEILQKGKINYSKSELQAKPDPRYALEGITHDNQHVRVIFAPSKKGMVVITCIDMNEEWKCNCN